MTSHIQGHGARDRERKARPRQHAIDVTGSNGVPALVQRLDLLGRPGIGSHDHSRHIHLGTQVVHHFQHQRQVVAYFLGSRTRKNRDAVLGLGQARRRCSFDGPAEAGVSNKGGRQATARKPISLKGEQTGQPIGLATKFGQSPIPAAGPDFGRHPVDGFGPPGAESRGDSELRRRRIDGDMHHWPLIRPMLLEFLDQRRQFTHPSCSFKPHNSSRCGLGHQLRPRLLRERTRRGKKTPFRMAATQLGHHRRRMAVTGRLKCGEEDRCHASKVSGEWECRLCR